MPLAPPHFHHFLAEVQDEFLSKNTGFKLEILQPGQDIGEFEHFVRHQFALRRQHYMLSDTLRQIEARLEIAERGTHFLLYQSDRLVGVMRTLPAPFELNALTSLPGDFNAAVSRHVEFSRLISDESTSRPGLGTCLIAAACRWAIEHGHTGVVAVSKETQKRMFGRFGLRPANDSPLNIASRNGADYWLMTGNWHEIALAGRYSHQSAVPA